MLHMGDKSNVRHSIQLFVIAGILATILWFRPEDASELYVNVLKVLIVLLIVGGIYLCVPAREDKEEAKGFDYETYIKHLPNLPPPMSFTMTLDDMLEKLDDTTVQKIMRDTPPEDLALALGGASGKVRLRFINNMGSRGGMMLVDDILALQKTATAEGVQAKQQQIAELQQKIEEGLL